MRVNSGGLAGGGSIFKDRKDFMVAGQNRNAKGVFAEGTGGVLFPEKKRADFARNPLSGVLFPGKRRADFAVNPLSGVILPQVRRSDFAVNPLSGVLFPEKRRADFARNPLSGVLFPEKKRADFARNPLSGVIMPEVKRSDFAVNPLSNVLFPRKRRADFAVNPLSGVLFPGKRRRDFAVNPLSGTLGVTAAEAAGAIASLNSALVVKADEVMKRFAKIRPLIDSIQDKDAREEALDFIHDKIWPTGPFSFLARGRLSMNQLAGDINKWRALPTEQFIRVELEDDQFVVKRSREEKLNAFAEQLDELEKFMRRFLILPTKTVTLEKTAEALIVQAESAIAKARGSKNEIDIAVARSLAVSAKNAADSEKKPALASRAQTIIDEAAALAEAIGKPKAGAEIQDPEGGPDITTIALVGGGVAVAALLAVLILRK